MNDIVFLGYTQAELDLYYDQRRWYPNAEAEIERYVARSAAARSRLPHRTYSYGPTADETLDWFPGANAVAPAVIFVHGGAWINFTKDDFSFVAGGFVARGLHACVLNFAGLRTVRMPEMLAQVQRAIAWVARHARELNVDSSRVHLCGHSSGAHLATLALLTSWRSLGLEHDDTLHSATMISGAYDLEPVVLSARRSYVRLEPAEVAALSPIRHADRIRCPMLVAFCEHDTPEFKRHAHALCEALERCQKPVERVYLAGANHFDSVVPLEQPDSELSRAIAAFVSRP
jgi:arylformamidase